MAPFRAAYLALAFLFADGILPALASTSIAVAEPYEVNANETQAGRYVYTAFIGPGCTGTLITPHTIITAAHCFADGNAIVFNVSQLFASFGIDRNTTLLTRFYVTNNVSVAVHPSYNAPTNERDIAVMHIDPLPLEGPSLDFTIAPIGGYAKEPITPADYNTTVISIGWGTVDPNNTINTAFLRDVQLTLEDPHSPECQGMNNEILLDGTGFCTLGAFPTTQEDLTLPGPVFPYNRKDACNGDSGGPVIIPGASAAQDFLIGATAAALTSDRENFTVCGDALLGGLETSVGSNIAFINSMINQYEGTGLPRVNITSFTVSPVVWDGISFGSAHLDFLVNMTITTDYYMEPRGEFDGVPTPSWPKLAMSAVRKEQIPTTILPFEVVTFDTPSFTYTLLASNYQVVASISWDIIKGNIDMGTSINVLFKPPGQESYGPVVATLSGAQLFRALCSTDGNQVALRAACSKV